MAKIFRRIDNSTMGCRLPHGPCFRPGFWIAVSMPSVISFVFLPVLAMSFSMFDISSSIIFGPYLICSALSSLCLGFCCFLAIL